MDAVSDSSDKVGHTQSEGGLYPALVHGNNNDEQLKNGGMDCRALFLG